MAVVKKIIFFLLLIFLFTSLTRSFFEYRKNLQFYQEYKQSYEKEKKNNLTLKTEILKKSDLNEIEKTIRNKLNLSKPNEMAVIIPNPTATPTPAISPTLPVYQQWWRLYFP
ncbi:MAG: septum formation initiator family protein [Microgenomates group bacterium]|jgi:cell division protein FtsB|nr:septum formation initiator family protein [Microgenomates group bacterium]